MMLDQETFYLTVVGMASIWAATWVDTMFFGVAKLVKGRALKNHRARRVKLIKAKLAKQHRVKKGWW